MRETAFIRTRTWPGPATGELATDHAGPVTALVLSPEGARLPAAQRAAFADSVAAPGGVRHGAPALPGHVVRIEPVAFTKVSALGIEEQRVNVVLDISDSLERLQTLGDGYRVAVRIITRHEAQVLRVPQGWQPLVLWVRCFKATHLTSGTSLRVLPPLARVGLLPRRLVNRWGAAVCIGVLSSNAWLNEATKSLVGIEPRLA